MSTQADNAVALRMSLDPGVPGASDTASATTPLPDGWTSFCSKRSETSHGRWYATAPWNINTLSDAAMRALSQTVDAPTWPALHVAVNEQIALHRALA